MVTRVEQFDYDLVENYFLKNLNENDFWLFASHAFETEQPVSVRNNADSREFLEKVIFGIEFAPTDVSFMIKFRNWEYGTVYTQYDDIVELKDRPFFVTVEPDGESENYHIFKCLSNNLGSPSTQIPQFNPAFTDGIYALSDGYIWKFMTSTPFSLFQKFSTDGLIPVARSQQVEDVATKGIFKIVVENPLDNFGYERITGAVNASELISSGTITRIFLKDLFSLTLDQIPIFDEPNTYSDRSIYIKKSNAGIGIGAIETRIVSSGLFSGMPFVTIETPAGFDVDPEDSIEILPRVVVQGTGNSISAIPIFDSVNLRINDIQILNFGQDYSSAIASIVDPGPFDPSNPNRQDVRCVLRPIIAPRGGHGSNALSELKVRHLGLSTNIQSTFPSVIPNTGSYSKIGLVKNPDFDIAFSESTFDHRLEMILSFIPGSMEVGDTVSQGVVTGIIHEINQATNTIFVAEHNGPYQETFVSNLPLRHRGINYVINSINYSPYETRSGDVLTISDVDPIERTTGGSERIKIILDF